MRLCAWKRSWYIIICRRDSATTSAQIASISRLVNLLPWRISRFALTSCSEEITRVAEEIAHITGKSAMTVTLGSGRLVRVHGVVLAMSDAI